MKTNRIKIEGMEFDSVTEFLNSEGTRVRGPKFINDLDVQDENDYLSLNQEIKNQKFDFVDNASIEYNEECELYYLTYRVKSLDTYRHFLLRIYKSDIGTFSMSLEEKPKMAL